MQVSVPSIEIHSLPHIFLILRLWVPLLSTPQDLHKLLLQLIQHIPPVLQIPWTFSSAWNILPNNVIFVEEIPLLPIVFPWRSCDGGWHRLIVLPLLLFWFSFMPPYLLSLPKESFYFFFWFVSFVSLLVTWTPSYINNSQTLGLKLLKHFSEMYNRNTIRSEFVSILNRNWV